MQIFAPFMYVPLVVKYMLDNVLLNPGAYINGIPFVHTPYVY